jgi:hypothetical protein
LVTWAPNDVIVSDVQSFMNSGWRQSPWKDGPKFSPQRIHGDPASSPAMPERAARRGEKL